MDEADRRGMLLADRKYTQALAAAIASLREEGETCRGKMRVAKIEMLLGFPLRARQSWRRAIQLEDCPEARLGLGIALYQQGYLTEALEQFNRGLDLERDNAALRTAASIALTSMGDFASARLHARHALEIEPRDPEAMLCCARAELALGNVSVARDMLDCLGRSEYKLDEVALLHAELLCLEGDHEAALIASAELCEKHPASQTCLSVFRRTFREFQTHAMSFTREELASCLAYPPAAGIVQRRTFLPCNETKLVDVVIPVHNAADVSERCIRSVCANRGPLLKRIIVVDDASDRNTATMLERFAADGSITLFRGQKRMGFTRALQDGLRVSDAEVFVALNSDTIVTKDWLEKLYSGLRSFEDVAMIGPLSNNAAWQNYGLVLGEQGEFLSEAIPPESDRSVLAAWIEDFGSGRVAELSLVHGFCAMVDRKSFAAVGGLDDAAFPEGYGEFQDLSLRFQANGYRLLVALDTVVFHEKGASLPTQLRSALSLKGRKTLYDRYSSLNYLFLEASSAGHKDIDALRHFVSRKRRAAGVG